MFLALYFMGLTAEACEAPLELAEVNQYLEQSSSAMKNMDATQAGLLLKSIGNTIGCLSEPVSPEFASEYYLMKGILLWGAGKQKASIRYFDAAKSISPDIGIDTNIFPQQHEIHIFFKVVQVSTEVVTIEPVDDGETYYFDGVETNERPTERPTIFQKMKDDVVIFTDIVTKNETLDGSTGVQPAPVVEPVSSAPVVLPSAETSSTAKWVALGFGTAALASGGVATVSSIRANEIEGANESLTTINHVSFISASVTGVVATGAGVYWLRKKSMVNK
jgi:hypothetical protein